MVNSSLAESWRHLASDVKLAGGLLDGTPACTVGWLVDANMCATQTTKRPSQDIVSISWTAEDFCRFEKAD